jgi:hypothetical protein
MHRLLWQQGRVHRPARRPAGTGSFGLNNRGDVIGTLPGATGDVCECGVTTFAAVIVGGYEGIARGINDRVQTRSIEPFEVPAS